MFDGDEMNIHIAQSVQARNELKRIANVKYQIIAAKDSSPIIGCVQDALSGCYLLTKLENKILGSDVINFLCNTSSDNKFDIIKDKYYNGHEIFSYIIPSGINNKIVKGGKTTFEISNGKLIHGTLDKSTLSTVKNSIIHFIWDKYGPDKTRRFIDDAQRLALSYLNYKGFTFGIKDCMSTVEMDKNIKEMIQNKILEYNISLTQYENEIDQIDPEIIEANLSSYLNSFSSDIGNILIKNLNTDNNLFICVDSKSKGSIMNLQHMMGCLGQKSVEGARVKKKVENRTLPIFHKDDDTPEARGFIRNSFVDGVNSYEYFYDAMAGREGLIDTAIKSVTWETTIIIIENNEPKYTEIGKWIDNLLDNNKNTIQHFEEKQMELLDTKNIYIPTMDYQGKVTWGEISAITRHDPTERLYEIKTSGGRSVTVTDSKSLLVYNNETNEFKEMLTPDIKVGDYVPVTCKLCEPPIIIKKYNDIQLNYNNGLSLGQELREIPDFMLVAPHECITAFIQTFNNDNMSLESKHKLSMLKSRLEIAICKNTLNDVILDEIIEINSIDPVIHPKVYDLTIPSTFNFGLANGLQVRDTAKTGYIQRQLIKGLEDLSIKYDNTNRNAKNIIIQYVYGENGIDQSSQIQLLIEMISKNNNEIEEIYGFTKKEIKELEKKHNIKNLSKVNENYLTKIKEYRDNLRYIQSIANNNYKTLEEKYMVPVNLFRLCQDYSHNKSNLELDPQYIIVSIENLLVDPDLRLFANLKPTDKYLVNDDRNLKYLFEISLHDYICPKKCIYTYGLSKKDFDNLLVDIKTSFIKALVQPGEMVGIVAAQSIGEPTSQMSNAKSTKINLIIKNKKSGSLKLYSKEIGTLCDKIIKKNPDLTHGTGHPDSVETDLDSLNKEYYIVGVDSKEQTHWNKISHISRHPVNGNIMKVKTRSGRSVETTLSHSHLVRRNQSVEPILGSDLKVGMRIPVAKHIDNTFIKDKIDIDNKTYKLDHLFGWFIGAYLAEGSLPKNNDKITGNIAISNISIIYINQTTEFAKLFDRQTTVRNYQGEFGPSTSTSFNCISLATFINETCGNGSFIKRVPDFAFLAPNEFKAGLIQGYIDGDGEFICKTNKSSSYDLTKSTHNGNFNNHGSRNNIRVCSRSEELIDGVSLLLSYFDIFTHIRCDHVKGSNMYELDIASKYAPLYKQHIGSELHQDKLNDICDYLNRDDKHSMREDIDQIEGLGNLIATCGKTLNLPGQSRNYGRWAKKETIGRRTLEKYIDIFESHEKVNLISKELAILKQAANSNVIWDEIIEIEIYTPDQSEYVYDFTVPGNQTFMVNNGVIVHNTLNTKHSAGVASKSTTNMGVPRIEELLHYSRDIKTPQMLIYFDDNISDDKSKVNKISSYLTHLTIKELIDSAEIYYDTGNSILDEDKTGTPFFINNQKVELSSLQFVIRLKMNMEKMHDKEITLLDIKTKFISHWTKSFSNIKNMKKNEKDIFTKISRCAILSNNMMNNQIVHIRFNMSSFNYNLLTEFLKIILNQITLKGIDNVTNSDLINGRRLKFNKETGESVVTKEYMVYTSGINMTKLNYIKGINHSRCVCNNIETIYKLYGIEACRQILLNEFVTTYNEGGSNINHTHMSVLIDMMTHTGFIISIDRHGLGKVDSDPISRASFEKTMDHFIDAAIFNEKDHVNSVSSRIMLGRVIPGGTGAFELLLDTNKLENSEYTKDESGGRITFPSLEEESLFTDIIKYGFTKNDFFLPI